eukprot:4887889-Pyramimonas_sp.AAC.1
MASPHALMREARVWVTRCTCSGCCCSSTNSHGASRRTAASRAPASPFRGACGVRTCHLPHLPADVPCPPAGQQ